MISEARSSRSRCQVVPSEALKENLVHASLLASGGLLAIFGVPWLTEVSTQSLPSSSQDILPLCVYVQISFFHKDISCIRLGTHLTLAS